jgi:tetratricopeptide (TPR) repeat protein
MSVSFSPDGRRLASTSLTSHDGEGRLWETLKLPEGTRRQRELVSRVDFLFEELLHREEVLGALQKDPTLNEADRKFAVEVAQSHSLSRNSQSWNAAAWKVVKLPNAGKDAYARALPEAEVAVRLAPKVGYILNTLGVAQYRVGRYADALATLTKSEKLNLNDARMGLQPGDLAFLAMAQQQLGKKDEAKATLGRLREVMKQPNRAKDAEAVGFLREAEELIEGKAGGKKE